MKYIKSKAFRQGSIATAITVLGVFLVIVLYIVLSALSTRLHWRIDLTPNRMFELTQDSIDFIRNIDSDVNIFVLNIEDEFVNTAKPFTFQINEVLRKYEAFGPRINLEYVDIVRNPMFFARFSDLDMRPNQIIIESPETGRYKLLGFRELLNIMTDQSGQASIRSSRAEQVITSTILNVSSKEQVRISFLDGYNPGDFSAFLTLMDMNNYEIIFENLTTIPDIDPEATMAFLVTPARDISEDDLRKLDRFLYNNNQYGKILFYVAGAQQTPMALMPNLAAWLEEWGIAIEDSLLFEMDMNFRFTLDDFLIGFVDFSDNEASMELSETSRFQELRAASFYSRPITILFNERNARTVTPLLQTSELSGIYPEDGNLSEENLTGPHPVLTLTTEIRYQAATPMRSHVLVSSSLTSFNQNVLSEVNFANSEYFLNLMNTLADREDTIRIQDKSFRMATIQVTADFIRNLLIIVVVILPLGVLSSGIFVWLRRRYR